MRSRVIDGEDWIRRRIEFLRELLVLDPADVERKSIEAEIATLSRESGLTSGGRHRSRVFRRLRRRLGTPNDT